MQLQVKALLRSVVDEHLDGSARVIERGDDLAIIEVPHVQLQVGDGVMHLEKEGVQGQRKQETDQQVTLVDAECQRKHVIFVIHAARLCVDGGDERHHARELVDNRINGGMAQATPIGVLQVEVDLVMRLAVNGVTQHVGGVHDRLGPTSDTGTELEWVQQLDDCGALLV